MASSRVLEQFSASLAEAGAYERHFNEIQSKYRALASTWLLAAFGGVGFVLTQDTLELPFDRLVGSGLLGVAGAVGVLLLWSLDLRLYQQLLDSVFVGALALEADNPELPPTRSMMVFSLESESASPRAVWFYIGTAAALLLVATGSFAASLWNDEDTTAFGFVALGVGLAATAGVLKWVHYTSCRDTDLVTKAKELAKKVRDDPQRQGSVAGESLKFRG